MFNKQHSRGFTLIELLVVVAIIGILSAIVLAALGTARERAQETAAQATLSQVRAQAELDGDFSTVCSSGDSYDLILDAYEEINTTFTATGYCEDDASGYAVMLPENNQGVKFCVDSTGYAGAATSVSSTDFECVE